MTSVAPAVPVVLRPAEEADVARVQEIYAHAVLHGLASFEIEPPPVAEMDRRRREIVGAGLPYLVAEVDGRIGGYAYAGPFRPRAAYRNTVEDSVYIAPEFLNRGLGRKLLAALIDQCAALGYRQMVAVIGDSGNQASINLHARLGFSQSGVLRSTGYKLGRWVDTVVMQRALGDGDATDPDHISEP